MIRGKSTREARSEAARLMNAARKCTTNAGRKRSDKPRCPCQAMTARRAAARRHSCDASAASSRVA